MSFDDLCGKDRRDKMLQIDPSRLVAEVAGYAERSQNRCENWSCTRKVPSQWNLPLHTSTRESRNLATGAGRCSPKCAESYTTPTLQSSKSGSGWGLPSFPTKVSF